MNPMAAVTITGAIMLGGGLLGFFGVLPLSTVYGPNCPPSYVACATIAVSVNGFNITAWANGTAMPGWTVDTGKSYAPPNIVLRQQSIGQRSSTVQQVGQNFQLTMVASPAAVQSYLNASATTGLNSSIYVAFDVICTSTTYCLGNPANGTGGISGSNGEVRAVATTTVFTKVPSKGQVMLGGCQVGPNCYSLQADFSYTAQNLSAKFTDRSNLSGGTILYRNWTFGDGQSSTFPASMGIVTFSHSYSAGGSYRVTETVTAAPSSASANGQITSTVTQTILLATSSQKTTSYGGTSTNAGPNPVGLQLRFGTVVGALLIGPAALFVSYLAPPIRASPAAAAALLAVGTVLGAGFGYILTKGSP